jgi:adenylyltransferase/sulfurtransferase
MPEVGMEGQRKLNSASILLIGAGGLGSPLGMYLAAAGVGRLGLVDFDVVDLTNLQRQVVHGTKDVGRPKLESAAERIHDINPNVKLTTYETRLTSDNAMEMMKDYDIVIDGTDNFPTRYLTNDACVFLGKPNIYGSIFRFEGQTTVFLPQKFNGVEPGPCYRCLYPEPPPPGMVPSCAEGGVLGVLPGVIGLIQATEAVKLLMGVGTPLVGRLLTYNALEMKFRELKLRRDPQCSVCGDNPTITKLIDYEAFCGIRGEEAEVETQFDVTATELKKMLGEGRKYFLLDVREPWETQINRLDDAHNIPLSQLPQRMNELDSADEIIAYCKVGQRSAYAAQFLHQIGFTKVRNLRGGINAWAREVEPTMPRY